MNNRIVLNIEYAEETYEDDMEQVAAEYLRELEGRRLQVSGGY